MRSFRSVVLCALLVAWSLSFAQQQNVKRVEFPGEWLKWIHIAEPEFERRHLEVGKYNITVEETADTVSVMLDSPDRQSGFGSLGKLPGYGVEISKKDGKVLTSANAK